MSFYVSKVVQLLSVNDNILTAVTMLFRV